LGLDTKMFAHVPYSIGKWITLLSVSFLMLNAGTLYGFGSYSNELAEEMGRSEVDLVGSCGDLGIYAAILLGIFYDRYGPTHTCLLSGHIAQNYGLLCFSYLVLGEGEAALYFVALGTSCFNFSARHRGKIMGYQHMLFSGSSMLFTLIFSQVLNSNVGDYFLVLTLSLCGFSLLGALTVNRYPVSSAPTEDEEEFVKTRQEPLLHAAPSVDTAVDIFGIKLLIRLDFWLLFFILFFMTGSGLFWKNIIGSVGKSYDIDSTTVDFLVMSWALTSTITRLFIGVASDATRHQLRRPTWLIFGCIIMGISHLSYIIWKEDVLWLVNIGTGIGYGTVWATHPTLTSLLYGMPHLSLNISFFGFAPAFGGLAYTALASSLSQDNYVPIFFFSCGGLLFAAAMSMYIVYIYNPTISEAPKDQPST